MKKLILLAAAVLVLLGAAPSRAANAEVHTGGWLHGFYAFSSYGQRELIKDMDAVTFGWSVMEWDAENGARLNTTAQNDNAWRHPGLIRAYSGLPKGERRVRKPGRVHGHFHGPGGNAFKLK